MEQIQFGTDGWRALLGSGINEEQISRVALAFSKFIKQSHFTTRLHVTVGYDGRSKSDEFAAVFARVLSAQGIHVSLSASVCSTPALAYHTVLDRAKAGVMITASHNPGTYNGVKFKTSQGGPFANEDTKKVEALIDYKAIAEQDSKLIDLLDFNKIYKTKLKTLLNWGLFENAELSIAVDSMAGAGQELIAEILEDSSVKVDTIYGKAKTDFEGRSAEPIEKNLVPLSEKLKEGSYALGLATDGDADRIGVMDENGNWVNIQEVILCLADYMLSKSSQPKGLVKTLSVSQKLQKIADLHQVALFDEQVGFKYVSEAMIAHGADFGAEESGGFGYRSFLPERDGILSGLLILEMMLDQGFHTIGDLLKAKKEEFGPIFYQRIDQAYTHQGRDELLGKLWKKEIKTIGGYKVLDRVSHCSSRGLINSVKYYLEGDARWLLLRSSETEPMVRIYAEGDVDGEPEALLDAGVELIKN